jgi:hypothetical protein
MSQRLALLLGCLVILGGLTLPTGALGARHATRVAAVQSDDLIAHQASAAPPLPAQVTLGGPSRTIPATFVGVSIEYSQLGIYEKKGAPVDRVLAHIKPQNGSRLLLRIGGKSADHALWESPLVKEPKSAFDIGRGWLSQLSTLVRRDGLRVMLDLNLAVHSPPLEASFVRAVRRVLPRGRLAGLEIGNEPDLYWRQTDLDHERVATTSRSLPGSWSANYSAADYRRDYDAYARTLLKQVPGIALGGPEIISSKPQWLSAMEGLGAATPQFLTIHRYESSLCWPKSSPFYPTIAQMLNELASAGLAQSVRSAAVFAHLHGQALRLTEVNSVSCGGNHGVADSFASALWAPDALFELLSAGADSVDWHIRPTAVNAPFRFTRRGIQALPELYGMMLFADMTGPGATVLNSRLSQSKRLHVKAWAVHVRRGLRVLLINKGARAAMVTLHLGAAGRAYVRLLRAPRVWSSSDVRFGGQWIGSDGRWHGKLHAPAVPGSDGRYTVALPPFTAALVSAG